MMYNLFEEKNSNAILARLEKIRSTSTPQWGKMRVEQMMAHCSITLETPFGPDRKQHFRKDLWQNG